MSNFNKVINLKDNAHKRILRYLADLSRNPIEYVSFESNDENMFEGHATITVQEGIYAGISIHVRIVFPPDYPMEPPAAFIANGFPMTHRHHEHVHSGGSICCDLTSNFKSFFRQQERSGWSSACSLSSLLMQLGTFFSDPDLPPREQPSEDEIHLLRLATASFVCPTCSDVTSMDTCESGESVKDSASECAAQTLTSSSQSLKETDTAA